MMSGRVLALLLILLLPGPAPAHAVLTATVPEDAARLEVPPAELLLRFNEPVRPVAVRLVDHNGHAADAALESRAETLALIPRAPLAAGPWVVDYRVMSGDGHPVAGTIGFGVASPPPADERPPDPDAALLRALGILARALHYGGLLIAAGGGLFLVLVTQPGGKLAAGAAGGIRLAALAAILGAVASLGLSGAAAAGLPLAALTDGLTWLTGLAGSLGTSATVAAAGLAILVGGLAAGGGAGALPAVTIGSLLAASSLALTGHAASAPPPLLAVPALTLHVLAAAFWGGSLWPLAVALRRLPGPESAAAIRRFSGLALIAVALLIVTGTALTLLQSQGSPDPLATGYGRLWLLKMGCVALLLGIAAVNKLRLTPALIRHDTGARRALRRSIAAEAVLFAAAVALTAALGATPPPRALALAQARLPPPEPADAESAPGYLVMTGTALGTATIEVSPARAGANRLTIQLSGAPPAARLHLISPLAGAPEILRDLLSTGSGRYRAEGLDLAAPGRWTVVIETPDLVMRTAVPIAGTSPGPVPVPH